MNAGRMTGRRRARPSSLIAVAAVCMTLIAGSAAPAQADADADAGANDDAGNAATLSRAVVVDGDTIQTAQGIFDLYGIDAPELGQRCLRAGRWTGCGKDAAFALHRLLGLALTPPDCRAVDPPVATEAPAAAAGHQLGTCALEGKKDLALVLLSQGLALALPDAPVRYTEAEKSARAGGLGLWGTDFVRPRDWRRGGRLPDDPVEAPPPCPIKAVIDQQGRHVYLVPLDPGYAAIPDAAVQGLYCSNEGAEADGWVRPPLADVLAPPGD